MFGVQFFTQKQAVALITSAEEGGALFNAMDEAYDSWRKAMEQEDDDENNEEEGGEEDEDEDDEDDEDNEDDDYTWAEQVPWKDEE